MDIAEADLRWCDIQQVCTQSTVILINLNICDSCVQLYSRPSPFANETGKLPNGFFEPSPQVIFNNFAIIDFNNV